MASLHSEPRPIQFRRALPFTFSSEMEPHYRAQPDAPTHVLLERGSLQPGEFERAEASTVEVMGLWGSTVLFAKHLPASAEFLIGEGNAVRKVDFEISGAGLGATRFKLVELRAGVAHVVVPEGARATISQPGGAAFAETRAMSVALVAGTVVEIEVGGLKFRVARVPAAQATPRAGLKSAERSVLTAFGLSFGIAAALLAGFAFWLPDLGDSDSDDLDQDRLYTMKQYLSAQAERNREKPAENAVSGQKNSDPFAPAQAAEGRAGTLGKPNLRATNQRAAVAGDSPLTELSHAQALEAARSFGMIELLGSSSDTALASSPFARSSALGHGGVDAEGGMWGDPIGESGGGGLALGGPDNGGGGHGLGVGIAGIGTCGSGNCGASGWGQGNNLGHGEHKTGAPRITPLGVSSVTGTLPAEVVQRIVRQNYGRFRICYENGLQANPNLSGRVTARFVIGRDGAVSNVANGGSDLPSSTVVACVVQAFYGLSFPAPSNGTVRVSYPIMFSPG